jgi:pimeloyl-ACP methyl ester carboxylesterase
MHTQEVTLHGHRISYRERGEPGQPVVLLIHGITSSSATWDPVLPELSRGTRVIAPDLLGHGRSDKPRTDYSLGSLASMLRDLLEHLDLERVTVVGHSLGGGVAMQFSYQYPAFCERIVLVDSGGLGKEVSWALRAAALPGAEFVLPAIANTYVRDAGTAIGGFLGRLPMRPRPSVMEVARGYASLSETTARTAFVDTLRSVVGVGGQRVSAHDRLYLTEDLPTLIVWGQLDTVIPVTHAYHAHDAIPGSTLEIFEQSRHFPHMDEPARFARVLRQFIESTSPAALDRAIRRERLARGAVSGG